MRRTVSIVGAVCLLLFVMAAPASAAQAPRIHDSGTVSYAFSYTNSCSGSTCTDTYINARIAKLDSGTTESVVCVDTFTYPTRGRGGSSETHGCGPASNLSIASDLSSATFGTTTISDAVSCTPKGGCSPTTITIGGTFTASGAASSYSNRSTFSNGDCTERFAVKGSNVPATFQGTLNGGPISSSEGAIGKERYTFSSTCVFGPA